MEEITEGGEMEITKIIPIINSSLSTWVPLFHSHLVLLLQAGDQTATVLTLCAVLNLNLMQEIYQLAIWDLGGLEVLLNLLDTKEERYHVCNCAKAGARRFPGRSRAGHVCQPVTPLNLVA